MIAEGRVENSHDREKKDEATVHDALDNLFANHWSRVTGPY